MRQKQLADPHIITEQLLCIESAAVPAPSQVWSSPLANIEAAWVEEIEERVAAFDRGEILVYPAEDVFAEARSLSRGHAYGSPHQLDAKS